MEFPIGQKNAKAVLSRYILFSAYFPYDEDTK